MASATQISERALKRLGLVPAGDSASSTDVADATEALSAMIASWEGCALSGDVLPLDVRFEKAVVDMLAVEIAPMFGVEPSAIIIRDADMGWQAISGAFFAVPQQRFDSGLIHTGHYANLDYIVDNEDGEMAAWQASTVYPLRRSVRNGANVYECVTAGTSDTSGGPTGTGSEITDGTVVWCWRRVEGA